MSRNLRLVIVCLIILFSAFYAVMVAENPQLASAVASGYVALLITAFILVNIWKRE